MTKAGNSNVGVYVLLGILGLGLYLLWRSLQNLGSSISGIGTSAGNYASGFGSTLTSEGSSIFSTLVNPLASVANAGFNVGKSIGSSFTPLTDNLSFPSFGINPFGPSASTTPVSYDPTFGDNALLQSSGDAPIFNDPINSFLASPNMGLQPVYVDPSAGGNFSAPQSASGSGTAGGIFPGINLGFGSSASGDYGGGYSYPGDFASGNSNGDGSLPQ